ncbi:MAG: hypothetical protein ACRCV9_05765, partial [Burkholderiaceae bacterium]
IFAWESAWILRGLSQAVIPSAARNLSPRCKRFLAALGMTVFFYALRNIHALLQVKMPQKPHGYCVVVFENYLKPQPNAAFL